MSASVFGAAAAVTMLNRAFNNSSPANAVFNNQVATAGSTDASQFAFATTFAQGFASMSNADLASRVMGNLGMLPNDALLAAFTDYLGANGVGSRGVIVLQLSQILSTMENATGDLAIYAPQAVAWNKEVEQSFIYSSNIASTTAYNGDFAPTPVDQGQTFTLTEGVDNIVGTGGNDTIIAGVGGVGGLAQHTLGSADVINGGAGVDTLKLTLDGQTVVPRMTGVEKVFAQSLTGSNVNMVNATGVQELWSDNSTANLFVTNLQEKAAIGVKGGNGSFFGVQAAVTALGGDLAVVLDSANVGGLVVNSGGATPAYSSVSINAMTGNNAITGKAGLETNQVGGVDFGTKLATVTVTGDGAVRVSGALADSVATIDASANKGGTNFTLGGGSKAVTYTGGEGADRVNFGGTLALTDKVDGGAGRDVLAVTNETAIIAGLQVSNVEILELNALNGKLNAAAIAGVDEVRVTNALNNGIVNGLTSDSTFVTNASGNVELNVTKAQVAGTNDTLNLKTGIVGFGGVNVQAAGVETIVYTQTNVASVGAGNTMLSFFDTDGTVDMTKLTIANTLGNSVSANGLVNTIKTVDAGAATGTVAVSIAGGNATNGVSITGGSGDDFLRGGDGKDVIVGGAGKDRIDGGDFLMPGIDTADQATYDLSSITVKIGDTATVSINGTAYTAAATAATPGNLAGLLAAQIQADVGINGALGSAQVVGNTVVVQAATTGAGSNFGIGAGALTHTTDPAGATLPVVATTTVPAANATKAASTLTFNTTSGTFAIGDVIAYSLDDGVAGGPVLVSYTVVGADIVLDGATTAANIANKVAVRLNAAAAPAAGNISVVRTGNELSITSVNAGETAVNTSISLTLAGTNTATGVTLAETSNGTDATAQTVQVDFNGQTYATGDVVSITWNDGVVNTVNFTVGAATTATAVAAGLDAAFLGGTSNVTNAAGVLTIQDNSGPAGSTATITAVASTIDKAPITSAPAAPTIVQGVTGLATSVASSDILTGGDGADVFVFGGQSSVAGGNMDTITDLNLGGAVMNVGMDTIQLSAGVLGYAAFNPATSLVNAGGAVAMSGPTLAAALQGLYNAGGTFDGAVNNVGLFTYGADTYLIAADSVAGLGPNDIVIKVTGVTGTLDLSDLTIV